MSGGKTYRDGVNTVVLNVSADVQVGFTDLSGTPGVGTFATPRGRIALPAASATLIITNPLLTPASMVIANINGITDATLTSIIGIDTISAPGTAIVAGNAASTGIVLVDLIIVN